MGGREYQGAGGLRVHLEEPLTAEMKEQIATGKLTVVSGQAPDVEAGDKSLVVVHGSEATTVDHVGVHRRAPGERPRPFASAGEWATYAEALGLVGGQACVMSQTQIQEWVQAHEDALGEGVEVPVAVADPETPAADGDAPEPEAPAKNAPVAEWRTYVIALGMDPDEAKSATKSECQDYAQVVTDARADAAPSGAEGQE
jgi:hypothetical protein